MFTELSDLIKARALTLTVVSLGSDRIRVCVIPQSLESDKNVNDKVAHNKEVAKIPELAIQALTTPLCLEGTAAELDAEMPEKLAKFNEAHSALRGGLSQAQAEIAEAVKAIDERNKAKTKSKQTASDKESKDAGTGKTKDKQEGEDKKARDTSASLPLEWLAPPKDSGTNPTPGSATNPETILQPESAQ